MKLRTATPASISFTAKSLLVAIAVIMAFAVPIQLSSKVYARDFNAEINAIQQDITKYQAEAAKLGSEVKTLQAALNQIANERAAIQAQVDLSQAQYDKLVSDIAETEKKIKNNQDALGETIANLYVGDKITPLEMIASSKNVSEYLDKQEYRNSVRDQLTSTIAEIKDLKTKLNTQKDDVSKVLAKQQAQKTELVAKEAQQQSLVSKTQGQEQAYQQMVSDNQQRLSDVTAQQQAYFQSLLSRGGSTSSGVYGSFSYSNLSPSNGAGGCSAGYPYCQAKDSMVDPWGLYNRECVSYVAWALQSRFSRYVGNFSGSGNAYEWAWSAPAYSGAVRVYDPQPGDAVILPISGGFAPVGHLMIVESVSGSSMHVSQFNFYGTGQYSTMDIDNAGIILMRFPAL